MEQFKRPLLRWVHEGHHRNVSWIGYRWRRGVYYQFWFSWRWNGAWHFLHNQWWYNTPHWGLFMHDKWTDVQQEVLDQQLAS